jgi:hypothetical protein
MERRDFLRIGTAAGLAAASSGGCAFSTRALEAFSTGSLAGLAGVLDGVDRAMEQIGRARLVGGLVPAPPPEAPPEQRRRWDEAEELGRKTLRTLYLTGVVKELSAEEQRHPEVQRRLVEAAPEMDEAVLGMTSVIASLTPADRGSLQEELRRDPELGLRISSELDEAARGVGTSLPVRLKTRATVSHLSWRLRVQPPSLLIDEYVDKVLRVGTRSGPAEALRRELAARMSEEAFWRHEERLAALVVQVADGAGARGPVPPGIGSDPALVPRVPTWARDRSAQERARERLLAFERRERRLEHEARERANSHRRVEGRNLVLWGGGGLGIGAALLGLGAVLIASPQFSGAWIGGAVLLTVGSVVLLIGLIALIAGAVIWGRARATPPEEP